MDLTDDGDARATVFLPTRTRMVAFLKGSLSPEETEKIALHIDECATCSDLLPEIESELAPSPAPPRPIRLPYIDEAACSRLTRLLCTGAGGRGRTDETGSAIRIGRFEVVRRLAAGDLSTVFLGNDPLLGRLVALRVPSPHMIGNDRFRQLFVDTGELAQRTCHPNLISVYEVVDDSERPFVVSRYCSGPTLQEWLKCFQEILGVVPAIRLVRNLADAAEHAFQHGVLFRSLSPTNVLVDTLGSVDLGALPDAVRISAFELPPTGPNGLPVEAASIGGRPDVAAIGGLLYRLVTGREPSRGGLMRRLVCRGPVPPRRYNPLVPRKLQDIILACLTTSSVGRYATAADLRDDLDQYLPQALSAAGGGA